jgi:mevalonate kinase
MKMDQKLMKISIGGKSIFSGEYSLLHGEGGIAALFDETTHFTIKFDDGLQDDVLIISDRYGESSFSFDTPVKKEFRLFQTVLSMLNLRKVCIQIENTSSFHGGFGTSGACIVAMCAFYLFHGGFDARNWREKLFSTSIQTQKKIYPQSSGMDIASEIFGGVLYYHPDHLTVNPLDPTLLDQYKIIAVDCGYKTSTEQCIKIIDQKHELQVQKMIFEKISSCTQEINKAFSSHDASKFEFFMNQNHDLLIELGVCDPVMTEIIQSLRENDASVVKISGSGLGDCILSFFKKESNFNFMKEDSTLSSYNWKELTIDKKGIVIVYE